MRGGCERSRAAGVRERRARILTVLAIVGSMGAGAGAQVEVDESGLHNNANVYGIKVAPAEPSYRNESNISVWARGETNPSLFTNLWFYAYGLHTTVNLVNTGDIGVHAVGGNTLASGDVYAPAWARGIFGASDVDNTGAITMTATGGTAGAEAWNYAFAEAFAAAHGIGSDGKVNNTGALTITATGGTANITDGGFVHAGSTGIDADDDVHNTGAIDVTATGGTASVGRAYTYADATGIRSRGNVDNAGLITARATAGPGDGAVDAYAYAYATGLSTGRAISNSGAVTARAVGGAADSGIANHLYAFADAYAVAYGLQAVTGIHNTGAITADATGGSADADAGAQAYGLKGVGSVDNAGTVSATATGGTAGAFSVADANAFAYGVYGESDVVNHGALTVASTGGTADNSNVDARAVASGNAYGVCSVYGLLTNDGSIAVTATGGTALSGTTDFMVRDTLASGSAYGLYAQDGAIENSAAVNAAATGGSATGTAVDAYHSVIAAGRAYGLRLDDTANEYPDRRVNNSGNLTATAAGGRAQGSVIEANASAWAYGIASADAPVVNNGAILASATGGDALSNSNDADDQPETYANAVTYGIQSDPGGLNNSGAVTVTAGGGTATGQGTARAAARAEVHGIYAAGEGFVWDPGEEVQTKVRNQGAITATARGGTGASVSDNVTAQAEAFGLTTYYADVDNSAPIIVTAQAGNASAGADAVAMASASGLFASSGHVTNSGRITVAATAGTVTAGAGAMAFAPAVADGIAVSGATLTNSGDITVTARGGSVTGGSDIHTYAYAYGIQATAAPVNNSGVIIVTATAAPGSHSYAYGISSGGFPVTNTGVIRATAETAFEVHVTAGTTTLLDTYNVTLDGDPDQASFGVADGATLALNRATLTVTAISGATRWDTPYRLFQTEGSGVVDGNFAEVRAVNPNTSVTYDDQGTAGSVDDTVALAYTPVAAPALAGAAVEKQAIAQAADVVNQHLTTSLLQNILAPSSSALLASAGSTAESLALARTASDRDAGLFVEPYYSHLDKEARPLGYEAQLWGFSAGYERFLGTTLAGLHLGYGQSDIEYTGAGLRGSSEDQEVVTGGFHALTRWDPWTLRYGLTGFYGRHDYQGLTGLALDERETASYNSYGTAATVMAGHIFRRGAHVLLPEAGLNWLWTHRPRFTSEATDPSWNTTYSALDDHDVYAAAAVRWLSSFLYHQIRITPSAAVGVRHLLTDAQAGAWQSIPGAAPVLVKSEQDRTALTLSGSLLLTRTPHAVSLAYDGEYAPDAQRHSVWLRYSWLF